MTGAKPLHTIPPSMTLRALLDARRAEGRTMSLDEAIAVIVPLCLDLHERHARGEKLYVHPSGIAPDATGLAKINARLALVPTNTHDRHCLAPELQSTLEPGDARASVYSVGAILYEMVTGSHVGPAMRRPREADPSLPEGLEILIGKSIIGDRTHRPADLSALASAMYHIAPAKSIHPPEVEEARIDESAELDVDIKFSMMPPAAGMPAMQYTATAAADAIPRAPSLPRLDVSSGDPFGNVVERIPEAVPSVRRLDDPVIKLAALKARLESDPRPRYVVSKDRMDHGPFSAVELLQQIASNTFTGDHGLRDEISGQQKPVKEWEEFAPFAEQTQLKREVVAEEKAVVRAVRAEKKGGIAKFIVAAIVVLAAGGALTAWLLKSKGTRNDEIEIAMDRGSGSVDLDGGVKRSSHKPGGGGGKGGPGGGPVAQGGGVSAGGASYDDILNTNNQQITMGGAQTPDLTNAQLAAPLRAVGARLGSCGVPDDMKVSVRVAVKSGRAVGVTVTTSPPNGGAAGCVAGFVRGLSWPVSEKADFVTINF